MTEQAFVESADGTRIPLFLTHGRDVEPDGAVPTLLYGYGGFAVSIGPIFKPEWLARIERGGLLGGRLPWRRRVRQGVARCRAAGSEAERLR